VFICDSILPNATREARRRIFTEKDARSIAEAASLLGRPWLTRLFDLGDA